MKLINGTWFEILTVMSLIIQVLWNVLFCHWASVSQRFEGLSCRHIQGSSSPRTMVTHKCDQLNLKVKEIWRYMLQN
jgi:hypothetical protein